MGRRKGLPVVKAADLPEFVLVGSTKIPVTLVDTSKELAADEAIVYGEFVQFDNYIKINKKLAATTAKETVVHEWLHAVLHLSGSGALLESHPGVEESIVRAVTTAVLPYITAEDLAAGRPVTKVSNP